MGFMQRPQDLLRVVAVTESVGLSLAIDYANMEGRQKNRCRSTRSAHYSWLS